MATGERITKREVRLNVQDEDLWRTVFRDAGTAIALLDLEGRLVRANPSLVRFLGYEEAELLAMSVADLTHPDDLEADRAAFDRLIAGEGGRYQLEKRHIRKDGATVWGLLTASLGRDEAGRPSFVIGMIEDIDARKRAEARLRALVDAMPAFVSEVDADHRYVVVNRVYEQAFGRERAELEGCHVRDVLGDAVYERIAERIAVALSGREVTYEDTLDLGYGPRRLHVSYIPHPDADGRVRSFFLFGLDHTERVTAERERHEALQRLGEKTRML
ncbi:MAG TPA: PAS domain S-box protein, partial [Alphaproteobacteria bacterium]|nr:PAS domain S-box protein [Alphaproteobacteria bacterium]